ncbi:hypothetical protein HGM15179_016283 [Zosterops borbonicus]|uniref:Uncharacterized protein n=1 Tax=Zosterops borbonicus TaxID=364589 RepID=A0A8K1G2V9_9PASS|nr:hypothetical protein HGM15179_016283 [Zosterops borbonicus]
MYPDAIELCRGKIHLYSWGDGESQRLTILEAEVSLQLNWSQVGNTPGPEALCILGIDYLRRGYFKDPKWRCWAFGIDALETEKIRELVLGASGDPSAEGQRTAGTDRYQTGHCQKYCPSRDCVTSIHEMICELENPEVVSKIHSAFSSPIWPVYESKGEWRLIVEYHGLNEVTPSASAAVPDVLKLQCQLESMEAKWCLHRHN